MSIVSVLGYGDCLITGMILQKIGYQESNLGKKISIIGNSNTRVIWGLLNFKSEPDTILFDNIPAFYRLRGSSYASIIFDIKKFYFWISNKLNSRDTIFFETPEDIRLKILTINIRSNIVGTPQNKSAYLDRAKSIGNLLKCSIAFNDVASPHGKAKTLLINPSASQIQRILPENVIVTIINLAATLGVNIILLDYDGSFDKYKDKVTSYFLRPNLSVGIEQLKSSDRYIGPDSFFTHLAYYFNIPQLAFFHRNWTYFAPPGLMEKDCIYYFDEAKNIGLLNSKISSFLLGLSVR